MERYKKKYKENYYADQLSKSIKMTNDDLEFSLRFKVAGASGATNWMNLNEESLKSLIEFYKFFAKEQDKFDKRS